MSAQPLDWTAAVSESSRHSSSSSSRSPEPEPEPELEPEPEPEADADPVCRVHAIFLTESRQQKGADGKPYVMYGARVHVGYASGREGEWWIFRRYSDWEGLYQVLLKIRGSGPLLPKPPPKSLLIRSGNAVERRKTELNKWLAEVTSNPRFSESQTFFEWLNEGRVTDADKESVLPADLEIAITRLTMEQEEGGSNAAFVFELTITSSMVPSWVVMKRFSHFEKLWELLAQRHPTISLPPVPSKAVVVTTTTAKHRKKVLEKSLMAAYRVVELATDEKLLEFLEAPPLIVETAKGAPPTRQGELQVLGSGSIDTRWFVLRGTGLSYAREQFAHWEASLDLSSAAIEAVAAPDDGSSGASQVISIREGSSCVLTLLLRAETDDSFRDWLGAIYGAAGRDQDASAVGSLTLEPASEARGASFVSQRLSRGLSGVSKNDEFCIKNEKLCIKNEKFCIPHDEFCIPNDEFCSWPWWILRCGGAAAQPHHAVARQR